MKSVTDLQAGVRERARDKNIVLTDSAGLETLARIYRSLAAILPWPELIQVDKSITTTATEATVAWPAEIVWLNIMSLEIQDSLDNSYYKLIPPPPDELAWNRAGRLPDAEVPMFYERYSDNGVFKLEFRPTPKSSKTVRIKGIIEPEPLAHEDNKTVFLQTTADDALIDLVAAHFADNDGDTQWANSLVASASKILQTLFGREKAPDELIRGII